MGKAEEFAKLLQDGKFADAMNLALLQAIELKITTTGTPANQSLQTQINLVAGQVNHYISEDCLNSSIYTDLIDFHQQQVQSSSYMVQQHLETLQQLLVTMVGVYPQLNIPLDNQP
jgi:hypothetical protein